MSAATISSECREEKMEKLKINETALTMAEEIDEGGEWLKRQRQRSI